MMSQLNKVNAGTSNVILINVARNEKFERKQIFYFVLTRSKFVLKDIVYIQVMFKHGNIFDSLLNTVRLMEFK